MYVKLMVGVLSCLSGRYGVGLWVFTLYIFLCVIFLSICINIVIRLMASKDVGNLFANRVGIRHFNILKEHY